MRVLETGEYIRVGGQEIRKTNVRIVAATNVNMHKAISEGRFREDLYYRLNTIPIQMPALRDRGNDILLLFRLFALQMAEKYRLPKISLSPEAEQLMLHYKWPGNVRQLKNITEQMSVLSEQRIIDADTLRRFIPQDPDSMAIAPITPQGNHSYESEREILYKILYELRSNVSDLRSEVSNLRKQMETAKTSPLPEQMTQSLPTYSRQPAPDFQDAVAVEVKDEPQTLNLDDLGKQTIEKALERNGGNRKKAARDLGISDRTLYRRIKQYGLDNEK